MNYVVLALIGLALVLGLLGFGLGTRRWSWATVAAAVLVLLAATGYLYLASRMAAYEWDWTRFVRGREQELARVRDALQPDPAGAGGLRPIPGEKSLRELADERDRLRQVLNRVDSWRVRSWTNATFKPPAGEDASGRIELPTADPRDGAADGAAEPPAKDQEPPPEPVNPGATLYVFDRAAAAEGGRYLGGFVVREIAYDAATRRFNLTVAPVAADAEVEGVAWTRRPESVVVYEDLPADRWLAFHTSTGDSGGVATQPKKMDAAAVEALLGGRLTEPNGAGFMESFAAHENDTEQLRDKDRWPALVADVREGRVLPGEYWARVEFTAPHDIDDRVRQKLEALHTDLGIEPSIEFKTAFEPGETAEFDLGTAADMDAAGTAKITAVFYRRRLRDARTTMLGGQVTGDTAGAAEKPGTAITAEGQAAIIRALRREIAEFQERARRLAESQRNTSLELEQMRFRRQELADDMRSWVRDAEAATRTAEAFAEAERRARERLADAEVEIVTRGRELTAAVDRLSARIDGVAPPPDRPAGIP